MQVSRQSFCDVYLSSSGDVDLLLLEPAKTHENFECPQFVETELLSKSRFHHHELKCPSF